MTEALSAARALAAPNAADTIAALASPPGAGARAVIRLSGPRAHSLASMIFRAEPSGAAGRRLVGLVRGRLALDGWPEVAGSLWVFHAPRSYTGEDAAEVHVPGSPPLVAALLRQLQQAGARTAQPGEFTRRAFLHGRLDLTRAEAVLELTRAEAEGDARAAARALLGGLRVAIDRAKARALDALAHIEATIDFPEEDLPGLEPAARIAERIEVTSRELDLLGRRSLERAAASSEPVVALAGLANAGKSTLLNALAGRDASIVSEVAGTTRDPVAALCELAPGRRVRLVDTAGEKAAEGMIERAALERMRELVAAADMVVYLVDVSAESPVTARGRLAALAPPRGALLVGTKVDLVARTRDSGPRAQGEVASPLDGPRLDDAPLDEARPDDARPDEARLEGADLLVSARTGEGLAELRRALGHALDGDPGLSTDLVQTERQARLVARAREALGRAAALLRSSEPARLELSAIDLHEGLDALGELTGALVTDDLLDRIFGEFCIGK